MNVLSLFDGMSCGQQALERAGIKVDNYYASEIDKHAIQITQKNVRNGRKCCLGQLVLMESKSIPHLSAHKIVGGCIGQILE